MRFVRAVHPDVGEATVPESALRVLARSGWQPVDAQEVAGPVKDRTIAEVLAEVGDDPVKAAAALEVEKAGQDRSTLTKRLERIANPTTTTEGA